MKVRNRLSYGVLFSLAIGMGGSACLFPLEASGQARPEARLPNDAALEVPSPRSDEVTSTTVSRYTSLLPPELASLITQNRISFLTSQEGRNFSTVFGDKKDPAGEAWESLQSDGIFQKRVPLLRTLPFGSYSSLLQRKDAELHSQRTLWNAQAVSWASPYIRRSFEIIPLEKVGLLQVEKSAVPIRGSYERVYPRILREQDTSAQFFRERIDVAEPREIAGTSWLTYRFFGADEDLFFFYSPSIRRLWQLTGSNRGDALLDSPFSPDDFFSWSGKTEWIDGAVKGTMTLLVPMQISAAKPIVKGNCLELPTQEQELSLIPREVIQIEMVSKDPYSQYGRQLLLIDTETFVPLYRTVYDRGGKQLRFFMTSYIGASSSSRMSLYPADTYGFDLTNEKGAKIKWIGGILCSALPEKMDWARFDPQAYNPQKPSTEKTVEKK